MGPPKEEPRIRMCCQWLIWKAVPVSMVGRERGREEAAMHDPQVAPVHGAPVLG